MRYLTISNVQEITIVLPEAGDCVNILDVLHYSGIPEMFEDLFEEPFHALNYVGDDPRVAPSEWRMVNELWMAHCEARRGNMKNISFTNLNTGQSWLVIFQTGD